jgi:hypothetical protein
MNVFQISDIAVVKTGGTPSRKEKDFYTNGNNLWAKNRTASKENCGVTN